MVDVIINIMWEKVTQCLNKEVAVGTGMMMIHLDHGFAAPSVPAPVPAPVPVPAPAQQFSPSLWSISKWEKEKLHYSCIH